MSAITDLSSYPKNKAYVVAAALELIKANVGATDNYGVLEIDLKNLSVYVSQIEAALEGASE